MGTTAPTLTVCAETATGQAPAIASTSRAGTLIHSVELHSLILRRDTVARHGRSEAALRAQGQPLQREKCGRLVDAAAELLHALEPRLLRRDEPENHLAVLGHGFQRLEASRALIVVFEKEAVGAAALEDASDALVASTGIEHRLVVAAADVESERDPGMAADHRIVHLDTGVDEPIGIAAALAVALAERRVQKGRVLGGVDLDVRAAEPRQLFHLAAAQIDNVAEVGVAGGIGRLWF